jgi:hypothetical protein
MAFCLGGKAKPLLNHFITFFNMKGWDLPPPRVLQKLRKLAFFML